MHNDLACKVNFETDIERYILKERNKSFEGRRHCEDKYIGERSSSLKTSQDCKHEGRKLTSNACIRELAKFIGNGASQETAGQILFCTL